MMKLLAIVEVLKVWRHWLETVVEENIVQSIGGVGNNVTCGIPTNILHAVLRFYTIYIYSIIEYNTERKNILICNCISF